MVRPIKSKDIQIKRNNKTGIKVANEKIKRKKGYFTGRQIFIIIGVLFILMGSGISYVWSNFEGTQIGYDLSRLQRTELELKELNRKLMVELATLKSPHNLEVAAQNLGLRAAKPEQIIILP